MSTEYLNNLIFKHMVELRSTDCIFCSTQEKQSGRTKLFLVFNQHGKIYSRNGLKGTWEEVKNHDDCDGIHTECDRARKKREIPFYSA